MLKSLLLACCVLVVCGCASKMPAGRFDQVVMEDGGVDGIPYRVPKRFKVKIYEKRVEGYVQVNEGKEDEVTIADPFHVNWISFKGLPLSNGSTNLAFNADGTLKRCDACSTANSMIQITAAIYRHISFICAARSICWVMAAVVVLTAFAPRIPESPRAFVLEPSRKVRG